MQKSASLRYNKVSNGATTKFSQGNISTRNVKLKYFYYQTEVHPVRAMIVYQTRRSGPISQRGSFFFKKKTIHEARPGQDRVRAGSVKPRRNEQD
jgi:hypothetical protein